MKWPQVQTRWLCGMVWVVAATALLPVSSSLAQRRPREAKHQEDNPRGDNATYRALIDEAIGEFDRGNWNEALALFQRAHALEPNARTLRGIGFCLFELRRYVDAVEHLERAMTDPRSPLGPSQRASAQQLLERAKAFLARVDVRLSPSDARLLVDGKEATWTAGTLQLNPGEHELSASAPDHAARTLHVSLQSGDNDPIVLELAALAAPQPALVPTGPHPDAPEVQPTEARTNRAQLKRGLMIGGFSLAGVGLISGTVTGVLTLVRKKDLTKQCPDQVCPSEQAGKLQSAKTLALISSISFGVAAAGLAIGLTGLLLRKDDKRSALARSLRWAAGPSSLALSGAF